MQTGELSMSEYYGFAYEPPGSMHGKQALYDLTDRPLADAFTELQEAFLDQCNRLGYRARIHQPGSSVGLLARHMEPPSSRNREGTLRATKEPALRASRLERNFAGRKLVRDLLDRLADGQVIAFGNSATFGERDRQEIAEAVWAGATVRDYPFHGCGWTIDVRDERFGTLTFHRREDLAAWRKGLPLAQALAVLSPSQMATYRATLQSDDLEDLNLEQSLLHWDLMGVIKTGAFELQVLHPPGPSAEFVRVSDVQSTTPGLNDINLVASKVRLRGTGWLPARLRHIGIRVSAASIKAKQTIAAETKAFMMLLREAESGPKTKTRDDYIRWLMKEIPGLSRRGGRRVWTEVTKLERFRNWSHAGRLKRN